jgi:hypothetical protein
LQFILVLRANVAFVFLKEFLVTFLMISSSP